MKPTWYMYGSPGTHLVSSGNGVLRAAQGDGRLNAYGVYFRMGTHQFFNPPYTFTGKMLVHGRMTPPVFNGGGSVGYDPGIVFHVMHDMKDSPWPGNEENIVMGFASSRSQAYHSVEIGGPGAPYGPRTGWVSHRKAADIDPVDGQWHEFRAEVYSHAHYALFWDDYELLDVVEKEPVSMYGPVGIGLRLDFFDIEMKDLFVNETKFDMIPFPGGSKRIFDSRKDGLMKPLEINKAYLIGRPNAVPPNATALLCNLTTLNAGHSGYIQVWGEGQTEPTSTDPSATNFDTKNNVDGRLCLIPLNNDGKGFFVRASHGVVDLIIDVQGYVGPKL